MTDFEITQLAAIPGASVTPSVIIPVVNPADTTTAPANSFGSNQRMTLGQLLPGFVWPSGDTSGVKDAAAINAAVSALPAAGGAITIMPGAYYLVPNSVTVSVAKPVWFFAWGAKFNAVAGSAGPMVNWFDSSSMTARAYQGGGWFGGLFDLASATAGSCAFHVGDIANLGWNVEIQNVSGTGSKGFWGDNRNYWSERIYGRIAVTNCGPQGIVFDNSVGSAGTATGSYERMKLACVIDTQGAGDGVTFQGGAFASFLDNDGLSVSGNMKAGAAQYAALRFTGSNSQNVSYFGGTGLAVNVENDGGSGTTPTTIALGASNFISQAEGGMNFGGSAFTPASLAGNFAYQGTIQGDANLAGSANFALSRYTFPSGFAIGSFNGATALSNGSNIAVSGTTYVPVSSTGAVTGLTMSAGNEDGQMIVVDNTTAFSLTFAVVGTSRVRAGTSAVIPANGSGVFFYNNAAGTWGLAAGL